MSTSFVGRERELAELLEAAERVASGRGALFLLAGEGGIGKTRLSTEFAHAVSESGTDVLWGWSWEGEGAPPFWPWTQVIRTHLRSKGGDLLKGLGPAGSYVARLVPDDAGDIELASVDSPGARFRLFDSVASFFRESTSSVPLVVILDDVHTADAGSVQLLEFLSRGLRDMPLLVLATFREAEARDRPEISEALAQASRHGQRIPLRGLGEGGVRDFIAARTDFDPTEEFVRTVLVATAGNPLFIDQYVRLAAAEGGLGAGAIPAMIPDTVRETISRRLSGMSPEGHSVLTVAAVTGREFLIAPVAEAAGLDRALALQRLDEAMTRGIVQEGAYGLGAYSFAHDLLREALYDALPAKNRAHLHRQVGEALERYYGDRAEEHASELARHFAEAARVSDAGRAVHFLRIAARQAEERLAFDEAVAVFGQAAEMAAEGDPRELAEALLGQSRNTLRIFDPAAANQAAREAAAAAARAGDPELVARSALALGGGNLLMAMIPSDLPLFEDAIAGLEDADHPLRIRLLARLAQTLGSGFVPGFDDLERARPLGDEALERARASGDPALLAYVLVVRHFMFEDVLWERERLQVSGELVDLTESFEAPEIRGHALGFRLMDLIRLGELSEARRIGAMHQLVAEALGEPFYLLVNVVLRCSVALMEGDVREAESLVAQGRELAARMPEIWPATMVAACEIELRMLRGGPAEESVLSSESALPEGGPFIGSLRLKAALDLGDEREARPFYERLWAYAERDRYGRNAYGWRGPNSFLNPGAWIRPIILGTLADACYMLRDTERAETLFELLQPYAPFQVAGGRPVTPVFGLGSYHLASLASLLGRDREAEKQFERTLERYERMGAKPWTVRTQQRYADLLARRGAAGDLERGAELRKSAAAIIAELGLAGLAEESSDETEAGSDSAVLRRDGDVWTVSYAETSSFLKDSKGLRALQILLQHPGREFHVLELSGLVEGTGAEASTSAAMAHGLNPAADDSAGPLLDVRAKAAYRARVEELQAEIEEAEDFADTERASRARAEMDALVEELSRAVGLGGRDRKAASRAERARVNLTRTLRFAREKIGEGVPSLGRHLERSIRTGTFCSYEPDPDNPIHWRFTAD